MIAITEPDAPTAVPPPSAADCSAQPLLSLCMIVRDSARTLGACLSGIRPWVDEIVVVDTGSTDDTAAIAAGFGARVFHFPWVDDFAVARNESLWHARGRWVFWMDADDTIDADNGRRLRELAGRPTPDRVLAHVVRVHCPMSDEPGADVTAVDHVKLVRNHPNLRFEGRIHEQILPAVRRAGGDVGWTDLFVTHSGSDRSPEGRRRKHDRDLRLLRLDLADRPGHTFVLFNLGMTLADAGDHAGAADALAAAVTAGTAGESHLPKAHALRAASLRALGRGADERAACERGLAAYPDDVELNFRAGLASHDAGRLADAERYYLRALRPPVGRAFASVDRGLGGHKALYNLAAVYRDQGRHEDALAAYHKVVRLAPDWEPAKAAQASLEAAEARERNRVARTGTHVRVPSAPRGHGREYLSVPPGVPAAEEAITRCERAVLANPGDANAHVDLAVALRRAGRNDEAFAAYDLALLMYRDRPAGWHPADARPTAELGLLWERRQNRRAEDGDTDGPADTRFTVLVGCYGEFPGYSVRALDSIAAGLGLAEHCDVFVGLNACGPATVAKARALADAGIVRGVVESRANRNKDPMMRLLVEMADTPYVLWLDDDTHFVSPDWPARFAAYLAAEHPLDVAGVPARWGPWRAADPAYAGYVAARPWWRSGDAYPDALREWVPFVPGGLFVARTAFLRQHDFPDRGMTKALDDVLLGELVQQVGGRLAYLPAALQAVARVSDGHRRGENFLLNPGGAY